MVTVPKALLERMCQAWDGTDSDAWWCENQSGDLRIEYSPAEDAFSLTNKEAEFCRAYKSFYEQQQFCGPVATGVREKVVAIKEKSRVDHLLGRIPTKVQIYEILMGPLDSKQRRDMASVMSNAAAVIQQMMEEVANGTARSIPTIDRIRQLILDMVPSAKRGLIEIKLVAAFKSIHSLFEEIARLRAEWVSIQVDLDSLASDVENSCFTDMQAGARKVNEACTALLGQHEMMLKVKYALGFSAGVASVLKRKAIWSAVKWVGRNLGNIGKSFRIIGDFLLRLGRIWSGKGVDEPHKENDNWVTKDMPEKTISDDNFKRLDAIQPDVDKVRMQLVAYSERLGLADLPFQRAIAMRAIRVWKDMDKDRQAYFLMSDGYLPEEGMLPMRYIRYFIDSINTGSNPAGVKSNDQETSKVIRFTETQEMFKEERGVPANAEESPDGAKVACLGLMEDVHDDAASWGATNLVERVRAMHGSDIVIPHAPAVPVGTIVPTVGEVGFNGGLLLFRGR